MRAPALVASVAVALTLVASAAPAAAQRVRSERLYELVVVDAGSFTRITDVNHGGRACGYVTEASGTQGFRWSTAGVVPLPPALGYPSAATIGITRDGFVLGVSFSPSSSAATLWSPAGTPVLLPDLGWWMSEPIAISDTGIVIGRGYAGAPWQPWVWDTGNGTRTLGSLGFPAGATATDVNASGLIAGAPPWGEAFLFDLDTATTTPIGTLGGDTSAALALNATGSVVGWSQTLPDNTMAPFFWSATGGMRSLGTPTGPGNVPGRALDVNRHDVVVGSFDVAPGVAHAFVWDANLGFRDLNTVVRGLGSIELVAALHISANGWIAGLADDNSQGGKGVGFLLRTR